ncbi:MAG: GAF domain-containing sensor histidine kinase [Candidatus Omnitrophota bacterium]
MQQAKEVNPPNNPDGLFNEALKDIMSLTGAECGSLFIFDPANNELILDSFCNCGNMQITGIKRRVGEGISGKVANLRKPVLVKNIDKDSRFRRNGFTHYHTKSFISIPLSNCEELLGLINIADKSDGRPFTEKDLECASAICRYVSCLVDIRKQKALLEKYASVGKLAAGVVHEVNNPLDGVIRFANILTAQLEHNSIAREYMLEIKKGLDRIANTTKSLLEFSHFVNTGAGKFKRHSDISVIIDECLETLKHKLNGNIKIIRNFQSGLPKILDFGMSHVVMNILRNAIEAMPTGGTLEIITQLKEIGMQISFKDTGIGVPEEIQPRIFEPFFTTKSIDKGTGLGLAICKEIINKYEGQIEVKSCLGRGSTFSVLIPRKFLLEIK